MANESFLRLLQKIFRDQLLEILIFYLVDIIIFSQDVSTHLQRLEMVLCELREHVLKRVA